MPFITCDLVRGELPRELRQSDTYTIHQKFKILCTPEELRTIVMLCVYCFFRERMIGPKVMVVGEGVSVASLLC